MNKKTIFSCIGGFALGVVITLFAVYKMAPGIMMMENESKFGFEKTVKVVKESIKKHGWKLSHVHDLKKTMAKFNKTVLDVQVFEVCHPDHAGKVLLADDERIVSSLMPCRVAIYVKKDGKTYLSRMNSGLLGGMMSGVIPDVMGDAARESEIIYSVAIKK